MNLFEEGKWLLTATSFETMNFVCNITNQNNTVQLAYQVAGDFLSFYPKESLKN